MAPGNCERRPVVEPETVDLYSCGEPLELVIHPSLDCNQPYLDLLHHSPFHRTVTGISLTLTVTFADVAASARNLELLQHLFTSSDQCVRQFYSEFYSYRDPTAVLKLFVHALNGGCPEVVMFLVEKFFEELTSDLKVAILEVSLWLATTAKSLEVCFQQLALRFGVNITNSSDMFCPLRLTCMYDNGDAAAFLIDHGADMYAENAQGCTVAYHAYKYGRYTFGMVLILFVSYTLHAWRVFDFIFVFYTIHIWSNQPQRDLVVFNGHHKFNKRHNNSKLPTVSVTWRASTWYVNSTKGMIFSLSFNCDVSYGFHFIFILLRFGMVFILVVLVLCHLHIYIKHIL